MHYIDVTWRHTFPDEPVRLVSELGDDRFEVRKLEFFPDGAVGYASAGVEYAGTALGTVAVPPLDAINQDAQFHGVEISASQFNELWVNYADKCSC